MEDTNKKGPRNNEAHLFKKCFKNPMFSLVPFEIWRDLIVSNGDLKAIVILSQTCTAFKELVDKIGENNFNLALMFRREDQIVLAKNFLLKCVARNNSKAMFHLGAAYFDCGWGFKMDRKKAAEWFKKSAELGDSHAMAYYAYCLNYGIGSTSAKKDVASFNFWTQKALSSNDQFAKDFCYGFELANDQKFSYFEASAKGGNEFGQYWFAFFCRIELKDQSEVFRWFLKSAEQGNCAAQHEVGKFYQLGIMGCEIDLNQANIWHNKAKKQGYQDKRTAESCNDEISLSALGDCDSNSYDNYDSHDYSDD